MLLKRWVPLRSTQPTTTKKGGGSSLLRQPEVAEAIVREVVETVDVPVTVKTRFGWDDDDITILDLGQLINWQMGTR